MKQKLEQPIPLTLEQFECQDCKKKFYVNVEDVQENKEFVCPFCAAKTQNIRQFDVEILAILQK